MSSCSLLARDQILSKSPIHLLSGLEHFEIRPSLNYPLDAAVTFCYFQSPAARPVAQGSKVEVNSGPGRVLREPREKGNESFLNGRGEGEELSLGRL